MVTWYSSPIVEPPSRITPRNHDGSPNTASGSASSTTTPPAMALVADLASRNRGSILVRGADSSWVALAPLERSSCVGSAGDISAKPGDPGLFERSAAHWSVFHRASHPDPGSRHTRRLATR